MKEAGNPPKLMCINCKKEVGIFDGENVVQFTNVRSMRVVPDNFRVSCRKKKVSPHGHRFKAEMLLMPSNRIHRQLPYVEYFDDGKRKLEKPCKDLPVMPALFDRNIDELVVGGPILRIIIDKRDDGDVSVVVKVKKFVIMSNLISKKKC